MSGIFYARKGSGGLLELAAKYETALQIKFADAFMDEKNKFYFTDGYTDKYKAANSTWGLHEFVSVNGESILGYIAYSVNRRTNSVSSLCAINFGSKSITFSKDFMQALKDIFEKYHFRKLNFGVHVGNPAEKMYDRYIRKFGGRVVGTYEADTMLSDGKYYDYKVYEIFQTDYLKHKV